ncbi:MAG: hypothetical protein U9N76_02205 [Candidatus Marinimicrobia bacterium]|nr:hypothetical protein [Candidatus Neomarinimicrobiota bacterium]
MKKLLFIFIVFSTIMFAETLAYQDTVYMKSGKKISCFVTEMNKVSIQLRHSQNTNASGTALENVEKVILEHKKVVYNSDKGLLVDLKSLDKYLDKRNESRDEKIREIQRKKRQKIAKSSKNPLIKMKYNRKKQTDNKWSFGVEFVPQFNLTLYIINRGYYYDTGTMYYYLSQTASSSSNVEGQFTYKIHPKLGLMFSVAYSSDFEKTDYENHTYYDDGDTYQSGFIKTDDFQIFSFNLGFKYYLSDMKQRKATPYFIIGGGKQFAFITKKFIDPFESGSSSDIIKENEEEFLEKLNSPLNINGGFGVEYAFNKSLSIFSNIQLFYSETNAEYEFKKIHYSDNPSYAYSETEDKSISGANTFTRIGVGLNFHF